MNLSHLTPGVLRELLTLAEKKQALLDQLAKIDQSISNLSNGTTAPITKPVKKAAKKSKPVKAKKAAVKPPATAPVKVAGKRSKLKDSILALLTEAGTEGIKVLDLAGKLAVKPASLHVWFNTTGKKVGGLTRVAPGKYSLQPPSA